MPWLELHTTLRGAHLLVRSDGAAGQMKSGRHFRFIASFHTFDWSMGMVLIWSHFESCHGKDLSDPECGRAKWLLRCQEMRHTPENPTAMKTSLEHYEFLNAHHTGYCATTMHSMQCKSLLVVAGTRRAFKEKKGKGIYCRVYHWMPTKSIRPLSSYAEIETLPGSCTMESHFFMNCKDHTQIQIRKLACFNCQQCKQHRYRQCEHSQSLCGSLLSKPIMFKSGSRDTAAATRESGALKAAGLERSQRVKEGMLVGSECTNESEPCIVSMALSGPKVWEGEPGRSWMGCIQAGDKYIIAKKLQKTSIEGTYRETDRQFYLNCEDVRFDGMQFELVERRKSSRNAVNPNSKIYKLMLKQLETLKHRCWEPKIN